MNITKIKTVDKQWHCTVSVNMFEKEQYLELINNSILKGKSKNNLIFRSTDKLNVLNELHKIKRIIDPTKKQRKEQKPVKIIKKKVKKKKKPKKQKYYFDKKLSHKENYHLYLKTSIWKKLRKYILSRDKRTCQNCGDKKKLQVHHTTYKNVFHENPEDLIALCEYCHKKEHHIGELQYNI